MTLPEVGDRLGPVPAASPPEWWQDRPGIFFFQGEGRGLSFTAKEWSLRAGMSIVSDGISVYGVAGRGRTGWTKSGQNRMKRGSPDGLDGSVNLFAKVRVAGSNLVVRSTGTQVGVPQPQVRPGLRTRLLPFHPVVCPSFVHLFGRFCRESDRWCRPLPGCRCRRSGCRRSGWSPVGVSESACYHRHRHPSGQHRGGHEVP